MDESRCKEKTLGEMVEELSEPFEVCFSGTPYSFRKFLWMGNWGIMNEAGTHIIIPARKAYQKFHFIIAYGLIAAGSKKFGWDLYNPDGKKVINLPPMPFSSLMKLVETFYFT